MKTRYALYDKEKKLVFGNLNDEDIKILNCPQQKDVTREYRFCKMCSENGEIKIISYDKDIVASSKRINSLALTILNSTGYIIENINCASRKISNDNKKILHNIVSISAHITQDIYSFFEVQDTPYNAEYKDKVKNKLAQHPEKAANLLFLITKHSDSIRDELLAVESIFSEQSNRLNKMQHSVHKVLMHVLYRFKVEFDDKNISCYLQKSDVIGFFDYTTVSSALYHIIGNFAKYTEQGTKISITLSHDNKSLYISINAFSLAINEDEVDKIFGDGYSGKVPSQLRKSGSGIGLFVANKLINANGGKLSVIRDKGETHTVIGIKYQENEFMIKLPQSSG
ncbi:ATP-binding protein [Acidithiobacillus montserratensis]|uniref:ATP-binding protein n=1 Tax=Acidithiobacillus montserratensis TaxID=2729135 RepID=A0ACD5HEV5_9PROT|nr:ATP-binding protein [Acidithiobacillus montserratensis]